MKGEKKISKQFLIDCLEDFHLTPLFLREYENFLREYENIFTDTFLLQLHYLCVTKLGPEF